MKRRQFIERSSVAAAAITIVPRHVLGGPGYIAPSDKINIACIGTGTQGIRVMLGLLKNPELHITSVADPVRDDNRYLNWGAYELRNSIRKALDEPGWDEGVSGCRAGREPARQIVETWYKKQDGRKRYTGCGSYEDYRELLIKEKGLDGVVVGSTDHQHAQISVNAMKAGKHVMCQKPMTNSVYEARLMGEMAIKTGLSTQVLTAVSSAEDTDRLCEMIAAGAIGNVLQVHNYSTRPVWPSGFTKLPPEQPVPDGFNWDLWLGPARFRPFSYDYTHTVFRSWYDFGTGAIGDMGCYSFDVIYRALKLGHPVSVEASGSTYCDVVDGIPTHLDNKFAHPRAMTAKFTFPARGTMPPVDIFWYDGGLKPPLVKELEEDGLQWPWEGCLYVGDRGKILTGFSGQNPQLIPQRAHQAYRMPSPSIAPSKGHTEDWVAGCKGGAKGRATFDVAAIPTEALNLAVVALRTGKKLYWDAEKMETGLPEADALLKPYFRPGYEL